MVLWGGTLTPSFTLGLVWLRDLAFGSSWHSSGSNSRGILLGATVFLKGRPYELLLTAIAVTWIYRPGLDFWANTACTSGRNGTWLERDGREQWRYILALRETLKCQALISNDSGTRLSIITRSKGFYEKNLFLRNKWAQDWLSDCHGWSSISRWG